MRGSTVLLVVACTFRLDVRCSLVWVWNWARPVPEGDRSSCTNRLIVTVSFPGRACHPLTV